MVFFFFCFYPPFIFDLRMLMTSHFLSPVGPTEKSWPEKKPNLPHHYFNPQFGSRITFVACFLFIYFLPLPPCLARHRRVIFFFFPPRRFVTGTRSYLVLSTAAAAALLICKFTSDNQSVSF